MRKSILLVAIAGLSFTLNQSLAAQEGVVTNKVAYVELGGAGVIWSVNLEGRFKDRERLGLGYRLGICYLDDTIFLPVGVNYVFGKQNSAHTFVTGANVTFPIDKLVFDRPICFLNLMYRYMPVKEGISFHIAFTPYFEKEHILFPWGTIGIGYTFSKLWK